MFTHTIATPTTILELGTESHSRPQEASIFVQHEKQEASVFFDKDGVYTHSSAFLSQPLSAKQMVEALPDAYRSEHLALGSSVRAFCNHSSEHSSVEVTLVFTTNMTKYNVKKSLSSCITAQAHSDASEINILLSTTTRALRSPRSISSPSSSSSNTNTNIELLLPEQDHHPLTLSELTEHFKTSPGVSLTDQSSDDLDVLEDEGGGREEAKLQSGDAVWLFVQPDETLPALPTAVVAETAAAAALQNLPQQLVALHACAKCHATTVPVNAAGDPAKKTSEANCTCGVTAGTTIGDYPGLSATPMLMNHLWVQQQPFSYAHRGACGIFNSYFAENDDLHMMQSENLSDDTSVPPPYPYNIPLPSIAMPLEGIIDSISSNQIKIKVKMPSKLASQWFPTRTPTSYTSFAEPLKLTPALVNERVAAALAAPGASASDIGHHAGAMAACLTLGKHHVAASTRYPLHASKQTKYVNDFFFTFLHFF
jgi:cytochrome c553